MRILYGSPISPFVRKVAILLEEKQLAYEWTMVAPHAKDEAFQRISPLGRIPAFQDGDIGLCDSSVICFYLERTYPQAPLYPGDNVALARALWLEEFFDDGLLPPMREIYFQTFLYPRYRGRPTDQKALAEAEAKLPKLFAYLERELGDKAYFVENRFSIADIALAGGFANWRQAGRTIDSSAYPRFSAYVERLAARPSFVKAEQALLGFTAALPRKDA